MNLELNTIDDIGSAIKRFNNLPSKAGNSYETKKSCGKELEK
jgi:hypothetical protein